MHKTGLRPNKYDIMVSKKVREFRVVRALSQEKLGEFIGVSIQQIQKYESGKNRISAGKLYEMAQIFKIPVTAFFECSGNYEIKKVNNRIIKMFKNFDKLEPEEQESFQNLINAIIATREAKQKKEGENGPHRTE